MSLARWMFWPLIRPIWRRGWAKIEARLAPAEARIELLETRLTPVETRIDRLESSVSNPVLDTVAERLARLEVAWREHVPSFLNAVATVPAFGRELITIRQLAEEARRETLRYGEQALVVTRRSEDVHAEAILRSERLGLSLKALSSQIEGTVAALARAEQIAADLAGRVQGLEKASETRAQNTDASIRSLWERTEFIRREILFETRHGSTARPEGHPANQAVTARVLAPEKVNAARTTKSLRLNIGCGHISLPEYVNIDMRELPGIDVIAEAGNLPFDPDTVDEIYSAHLVEHFPQETLRRRVLPHWHRLLRTGGVLRAITPDAAAMLVGAGAGTYSFEDFREVVFGAQDYVGDYHFNLFTPTSLSSLLEESGFGDIRVPAKARRNGKCFEFEITAIRV